MTDFLLEILSEEIPARMQAKARTDLEKLFAAQLADAGLKASDITVYSTPRRLALIATGLPDQTEAVSEEAKGPPEAAPDKAVEGFCRNHGITREQLEVRDVKGRPTYFAVIDTPGRATKDVLAEAVPAIIAAFPWPKSMRWGDASVTTESMKWVRPLQGIVAIFGGDLVQCEAGGIASGRETAGHRFHYEGGVAIDGADDYIEKLRDAHVIVDHAERQDIIREGAAKAASDAGLMLVEDEGLVVENAGLTERPVPLLGRYDDSFLDVPEEVIQLTTRINQKYFVVRDGEGALAPAFVCTGNIAARDGGDAIVAGNEKVLAARLADAKFFWELDQKKTLEQHAEKLKDIVFHEKLGTVADKVERVAKLARWLVEEGIVTSSPLSFRGGAGGGGSQDSTAPADSPHPNPSPKGEGLKKEALADMAEQAARLCKADLVTEMVGEFPELQGLMGGYYAAKEGLPTEVSEAIRDHYKPVGQGDDVPTAPVTVAVSLADKLDTLVGFFAINERPTGSKDPFALRRATLAIIQLLTLNHVRLELRDAILEARRLLLETLANSSILFPEIAWDEEWDELPELNSRIRPEQCEGVIAIDGLADTDLIPTLDNQWYVTTGAVKDRGHNFRRISDLSILVDDVLEYIFDRVEETQKKQGRRIDLIRAVIPKKYTYFDIDPLTDEKLHRNNPLVSKSRDIDPNAPDDLVRLLARVKALQAFVETEDGGNLLAGYKRASNILKKEAPESVTPAKAGVQLPTSGQPKGQELDSRFRGNDDYEKEPAEADLIAALDTAEPKAAAAIDAEDFEAAMAALASLRGPIDAFFENVTVNDDNDDKRLARLRLLMRVRDAVHTVADFSKIEG